MMTNQNMQPKAMAATLRTNTRTLDELGRVVLPIDFRRRLGLNPRDEITLSLDENGITMRKTEPHTPNCVFCGANESKEVIGNKAICAGCAERVKRIAG